MKYTDQDFDKLFNEVNRLKKLCDQHEAQLSSIPDFQAIIDKIEAFPDFRERTPAVELQQNISRSKIKRFIADYFLSTGSTIFSTKQLRKQLKTIYYHDTLWKMAKNGELIKNEARGEYTITDNFIYKYIDSNYQSSSSSSSNALSLE